MIEVIDMFADAMAFTLGLEVEEFEKLDTGEYSYGLNDGTALVVIEDEGTLTFRHVDGDTVTPLGVIRHQQLESYPIEMLNEEPARQIKELPRPLLDDEFETLDMLIGSLASHMGRTVEQFEQDEGAFGYYLDDGSLYTVQELRGVLLVWHSEVDGDHAKFVMAVDAAAVINKGGEQND